MSINEKLEIDPSDLPKSTWEKYGKPLLETKLIHLAKLIPAFSPFIDYLKSILDEQRLLRIESQLKEQGANLQALNLVIESLNQEELITDSFQHYQQSYKVLQWLNIGTENGRQWDYVVSPNELIEKLELVGSNDEIKTKFGLILNDLENQNLIVKRTDMNSPFGFKGVTASEILCTKSDDLFQNWNPMEDAKSIVKSHFQLGKMISVRDLQNEYTWSDRRLNSSIKYLEINDLLDIKSETAGIHNYHFTAFSFSPNASNLVRSDLK